MSGKVERFGGGKQKVLYESEAIDKTIEVIYNNYTL